MASRFWVGGTGTWDASDTTHWAQSSGTAGGFSVPGPGDSVTFDANSGGGTATVSGFTPSVGNVVTTASVTGIAFGSNGITYGTWTNTSGTSAINFGSGTIASTATSGNIFLMASSSNVTASSATFTFAGGGASARTITFGTVSYGTVSFAANSSGGGWTITGACTIGTLTIAAPNTLSLAASTTYTITNALTLTGASGSAIALQSGTFGTSFTLALGAASTGTWCSLRDMTNTTSSFTLTNSFDLGRNTFTGGGSISAPSGGGGGGVVGVIGG